MLITIPLAYVLVVLVSLSMGMPLDSPSHWALPAAVALGVYLAGEWLDTYTKTRFSRSVYYLVVLLLLALVGFAAGYYAFFTTFVLFGAGYPDLGFVLGRVLPVTPYWVVFPAILAGWLGRMKPESLFDWS